jgi:hypothetical protein
MLDPKAVEPSAIPAVQLSYRGPDIAGGDPGNEGPDLRKVRTGTGSDLG